MPLVGPPYRLVRSDRDVYDRLHTTQLAFRGDVIRSATTLQSIESLLTNHTMKSFEATAPPPESSVTDRNYMETVNSVGDTKKMYISELLRIEKRSEGTRERKRQEQSCLHTLEVSKIKRTMALSAKSEAVST